MPIRPPSLDDRSFNDLVDELVRLIPAHTPEWTHPRPGDPGRTLIELFAWLGDTILYRANLVPERQRLAFLRLLGQPLRPAQPARGLIALSLPNETDTTAQSVQASASVKGTVPFETKGELTVFPITAEVFYKRRLTEAEGEELADVVDGLKSVYDLNDRVPVPYVTTPLFVDGAPESAGFNLMDQTLDKSLWIALFASKAPAAQQAAVVEQVRQALGKAPSGANPLLNIGFAPVVQPPALFEQVGPRARIPHLWEMTTLNAQGQLDYLELDSLEQADTTQGLTRPGVVRLLLPAPQFIAAPSNEIRRNFKAGLGDTPPRLDVPEKAGRLVTWLRLRPSSAAVTSREEGGVEPLRNFSLSWLGVNAIEIDQRQTLSNRIIGQSNGAADQEFQLPGQSVEADTLQLQVEEAGRGWVPWEPVDDFSSASSDPVESRNARIFTLDSEAGVVRFGDGVRGKIPEQSMHIRVVKMRAGGGRTGNLPPGTLKEVSARDLAGAPINLKAFQPLPLDGGEDAETLEAAERRIPDLFRHRNRAVTEDDYRTLARETPGVDLGRVEVLPRFKPHQHRTGVPGVVSVMILPDKAISGAPNPRPDRPMIEAVHEHLSLRAPVATELYVIGCEYVPLGVSIGVTVRDGFGRDAVLQGVREGLKRVLWPLSPGGPDGTGWPLGREVRDRELEVEVSRLPGIAAVAGVNLFIRNLDQWQLVPRGEACGPARLSLAEWQLPELLSVVVVEGDAAPADLRRVPNPFAAETGVAVPVVPEVC
jgi:predicted phage baseplate assembly protein